MDSIHVQICIIMLNTKENYNILLLRKPEENIPAMRKSAEMLPGKNRDVISEKKYE